MRIVSGGEYGFRVFQDDGTEVHHVISVGVEGGIDDKMVATLKVVIETFESQEASREPTV